MDETDVPYRSNDPDTTAVSEDEALVSAPTGERYQSLEHNNAGLPGGEPCSVTARFRDCYDVLLSRYDELF